MTDDGQPPPSRQLSDQMRDLSVNEKNKKEEKEAATPMVSSLMGSRAADMQARLIAHAMKASSRPRADSNGNSGGTTNRTGPGGVPLGAVGGAVGGATGAGGVKPGGAIGGSVGGPIGGGPIGGACSGPISGPISGPVTGSGLRAPLQPKSSISDRRGMSLPQPKPKRNIGAGMSLGPLPQKVQSPKADLFGNYKKYIDIKTGSLNFAGKAALHSKGIDFTNGTSFRITLEELEPLEELGAGNYGTVTKVLHKPTNVEMAMKEIRLELDETAFRQIIMELDVLHRSNLLNIVEFYGAFFVESSVYVCMEYMDGGSINKIYQGGIPEEYLAYIVHSTILALKKLKESYKIIHRDVKPTNILCSTNGKVKLCDFGVSGNLVASIARTNVGCQAYMAPERIRTGGNMAQLTYTVESDIWSLGLSTIEMASGTYPYPPEAYSNIFSQLTAIVDGEAPALDPKKYSPDACAFVAKCLEKNPSMRPSYGELLNHPWLKDRDFSHVDMGAFVKQRLASAGTSN